MVRWLITALALAPLAGQPAAAQSESSSLRVREAASALVRGNHRPGHHALQRGARRQVAAERSPRHHPQRSRRRLGAAPAAQGRDRRLQPRHPALSRVRRRLQQPRQPAAGPRRRQGGGQGLRSRDRPGAGICRRLQQSRRRLHQARPGRSSDRRLQPLDRADAQQPGGAERAWTRPSRGTAPARRDPRFHAGGEPRCPLRRRLPQPGRGQGGHRPLRGGDRGLQPGHRLRAQQRRDLRTARPRLHGGRQRRIRRQGLRQGHRAELRHRRLLCRPWPRLRQGRGVRGRAQRFRARHRARAAFRQGIRLPRLDLSAASAAGARRSRTSSAP